MVTVAVLRFSISPPPPPKKYTRFLGCHATLRFFGRSVAWHHKTPAEETKAPNVNKHTRWCRGEWYRKALVVFKHLSTRVNFDHLYSSADVSRKSTGRREIRGTYSNTFYDISESRYYQQVTQKGDSKIFLVTHNLWSDSLATETKAMSTEREVHG